MYWNLINRKGQEFTGKYHYAPSKVYMSRGFYNSLEMEMGGAQWLALIKQNSVRGMAIVLDDSQQLFTIEGKQGDKIVVI